MDTADSQADWAWHAKTVSYTYEVAYVDEDPVNALDPLGLAGGWSWNPIADAQTLAHDTANLLNCVAAGSSCTHRVEANAAIGAINAADAALSDGRGGPGIPTPFPCQPGSGFGEAALFVASFFFPGGDEAAALDLIEEGGTRGAMSRLDRVGSALKTDPLHRATSWVMDDPAAQEFVITGGDGVQRALFQLPGEVNGKPGIFEWIVDDSGANPVISHQRFIPGGKITGAPNQRP